MPIWTIRWRIITIATRNPQAQLCTNQSSIGTPTITTKSRLTALIWCIQLEKPNYAVITFDLQIWLKAVDLIQRMIWFEARGCQIIPRLGGFYLWKSYLATFSVIFADSWLHDIRKLIYEGELGADSIINSNIYDKTIWVHFLIDAAILQYVIPASTFTDNGLYLMKMIILDCSKNQVGIGSKDIQMAERFRSKIKNVLSQLDNAGTTPSLWRMAFASLHDWYHQNLYSRWTHGWFFYSPSILYYK